MISRYTLPEMGALWSEENKFQKWLDVEIAVCEVHADMGTIPRDALEQIKSRAQFSVDRINEIEKTTDHDVIAFTTNLAESIGEASRFVHYGLTSSDVVDTANALLLRDASDILVSKVDALLEVLKRRAFEFKRHSANRPHPRDSRRADFIRVTFALWYDEMNGIASGLACARSRCGRQTQRRGRLVRAPDAGRRRESLRAPRIESRPVSTQVVQRDSYAEYLCTLAVIASSIDKFALQIRHWQRTEVREAQEKFKKGQKGRARCRTSATRFCRAALRHGARCPREQHRRFGECGALARARYLTFIRRTRRVA
jgi:adenylosuccinate lyase